MMAATSAASWPSVGAGSARSVGRAVVGAADGGTSGCEHATASQTPLSPPVQPAAGRSWGKKRSATPRPAVVGSSKNAVRAADARSQRVAPLDSSASSSMEPERSNITSMFTGTNMAC
jgi:hypothetical protein